jgi:2-succinyl-5-enolpyruvyl-6-hydroxy-3-cyclohexene-1-carboxylate synthase
VDELSRAGLHTVCIAPGSRSTPLTLAFAEHPDITVYSLLDERGAAFFALGLALAAEAPVALVCTSGTAAANFYPAIVEANYAQAPLLVLTTDRPHELRHSGANQTIDQVKMFGDHVRWFVEVAPPEANPPATTLRSLRTLACRALAATQGLPPGPVHLNFPFRKPLEPTPVPGDSASHPVGDTPERLADAAWQRPPGQPFTRLSRGQLLPSPQQTRFLMEVIQSTAHGLIICGPRCPGDDFPQAVTRLAQATHYPILADALSGVRFGPHLAETEDLILGGYESFWRPDLLAQWPSPELILRFGAMPISAALSDYLASATGRIIQISGNGVWQDDTHTTTDFIWADPALTCQTLAEQLHQAGWRPRQTEWLAALQQAEQQTWRTFIGLRSESFFEGAILADVVELLPEESLLYVASSLPVRHLDQFARPNSTDLRVFANRGASGIDGTIASALGAAAATHRPLALVSGDLAFYHDLNSLLALRRCGVKATLVLINNNGGGIFHRLPIAKFEPPFTELFVTPHGLDFAPAAQLFGLEYSRAADRDTFRQAFAQAINAPTSHLIEVPSDAVQHEQMRREMVRRVVEYGSRLKVES